MRLTYLLAKREFISFFASPIAIAFLLLFLLGTLIKFFNFDFFFSYAVADVRSLFAGLPFFMIFLVASLTMKLWSEEQKQGTLELLMTLPLSNLQLIMGKFLAGWAFIGVALIFTMGIPLTVAQYGPLDWGPVWGGYFAAFWMGGAYLAIGLCVSSLSDNQVMSLMVTCTIGLTFYIIGHQGVADVLAAWIARGFDFLKLGFSGIEHRIEDVILAFGTGSRFKSIEKGLLDSRDLFWYLSIIIFFLFCNSYFLNRKRQLRPGSGLKLNSILTVILVASNLIFANIVMSESPLFRLDLTEGKKFSLSEGTRKQIAELDEVLNVDLIFSNEMPDYFRPLVPQIKDMVSEFQIQSGGKLRMNILNDPNEDSDLRMRLFKHYNISAIPMEVKTSRRNGVISTFFHINLRYGDLNHVLSAGKLVEQRPDQNGVHYSLRNLEYELSRGMSNLFHYFQSMESVFKIMDSPLKMRVYYPHQRLQETFGMRAEKRYLTSLLMAAKSIESIASKKFDFEEKDSDKIPGKEFLKIFKELNIAIGTDQPILVTLEYKGKAVLLEMDVKKNAPAIRQQILSLVQGMLPGFRRTVGLWVPGPRTQNEAIKQDTQLRFKRLQSFLSTFVSVQRINFDKSKNKIPAHIDLMLIAGVENATFEERYALDQFIMKGKPVIYAAGYSKLVDFTKKDQQELIKHPRWLEITHSKDLGSLFNHYGVVVKDYQAQDSRCLEFMNYRRFDLGPDKGFFDAIPDRSLIDVRHPDLSTTHAATKNLKGGILMSWAAPLVLDDKNTKKGYHVLARTTKDSWRFRLLDLRTPHTTSFSLGHQPLAVAVTGERQSFFHPHRRQALMKDLYYKQIKELEKIQRISFVPQCKKTRLAVIGSHDFISDIGWNFCASAAWTDGNLRRGFSLFPGLPAKLHQNLIFIGHLVDWGLNEDKFAKLMGRESSARLLVPMTANDRQFFQTINYSIVAGFLIIVLFGMKMLRRLKKPLLKVSQN